MTGQPWTVPPFELTERDGYLYGGGVNDDKGMAAVITSVALELRRSAVSLSRDVIVALTAGEEKRRRRWAGAPARAPPGARPRSARLLYGAAVYSECV